MKKYMPTDPNGPPSDDSLAAASDLGSRTDLARAVLSLVVLDLRGNLRMQMGKWARLRDCFRCGEPGDTRDQVSIDNATALTYIDS